METILSLIAIIISVIALICSLVDTRLVVEYFFSNEYLLIEMKPNAKLVPHTHNYVSNCKFFGIIDTNWYAFDKANENLSCILKYKLLREGMNNTSINGLNLQNLADKILITRKGKKLARELK